MTNSPIIDTHTIEGTLWMVLTEIKEAVWDVSKNAFIKSTKHYYNNEASAFCIRPQTAITVSQPDASRALVMSSFDTHTTEVRRFLRV